MSASRSNPAMCCLCNVALTESLCAPERMFGMGGKFEYRGCPDCGMLSQVDPPEDLGPYYPDGRYYSFEAAAVPGQASGVFQRWKDRRRTEWEIFERPKWAHRLAPTAQSAHAAWLKRLTKHVQSGKGLALRVLDVGCGSGHLLSVFHALGFRRLEGVDPYYSGPEMKQRGLRIRRIFHTELGKERFDLVILNHSLEHMNDQVAAMRGVAAVLSKGGVARIEVPVADSEAYARYGPDWVELDPPRHLFLHTRKSLHLLAEKAGLDVVEMEEAGSPFEFWGSELYRRGIQLFDETIGKLRAAEDCFTRDDLEAFELLSAEAISRRRSGRVTFTLRRQEANDLIKAGAPTIL